MKRELLVKLKDWQNSPYRKPLLVMGARQVGKTTLLRHFGNTHYEHVVEINFDDSPELKKIFEPDLKPERLVRDIGLALNTQITPGNTLLFLDEIQECPNALNSLKYFRENANEYHVCGAGSLLGVKLSNSKGFPVGQVHFEHLYPLSFFEFLDALDATQLKNYLSEFTADDNINEAIHIKCIEYLKHYLLIGGMPEAVAVYQQTHDFNQVRDIHQQILQAYELDFVKHAPSHLVMKITECFHSVVSQLAKENKKFIYSVIREGARARNFEEALQWLVDANLFHKVYQISTPKLPIRAYEDTQYFKTYFCDVGLLNTMAKLPINAIVHGDDLFQEFQGSLTENFVAQMLSVTNDRLHYWTSGNRAEIDFILQIDNLIYPLEVKSGKSSRKKSLLSYKSKYNPNTLLRTSTQNFKVQETLVNIPLYLIGQYQRIISQIIMRQ